MTSTLLMSLLLVGYEVPFLTYYPGAEQSAMAGANAAIAEDANACFYNPAGLALQRDFGLALEVNRHTYDDSALCWSAAGVAPLLRGLVLGAFGSGVKSSNKTMYYWKYRCDYAVGASLGYAPVKHLALGLAGKLVNTLVCDWSTYPGSTGDTGLTFAAEAGAIGRVHLPAGELSAGLAVQNLGPPFRFGYLPLNIRGGLAYTVTVGEVLGDSGPALFKFTATKLGDYWFERWRVRVAYDVNSVSGTTVTYDQDTVKLGLWHSLGMEVRPIPPLAVRFGYFSDLTPYGVETYRAGTTAGLGFDLKYVRLDIADDRVFWSDRYAGLSPHRLRLSLSSSF